MDNEATYGNRREEILQTAETLFAERGYRETGLLEVSERMGFRRQAIYHYFKSKDDILLELIRRAGNALETSAEPTFRSDLPPRDKLTKLVRNHMEQVLRHAAVFRIQFQELDKIGEPRGEALREARAGYMRKFAAVIKQGQADGIFVDIPHTTLALFIVGMCNWATEWYGPGTRASIDEVAEAAAQLAVNGAVAPGRARRASKPAQRPAATRTKRTPGSSSDRTSAPAKATAPRKRATKATPATDTARPTKKSSPVKAAAPAKKTSSAKRAAKSATPADGLRATKTTRAEPSASRISSPTKAAGTAKRTPKPAGAARSGRTATRSEPTTRSAVKRPQTSARPRKSASATDRRGRRSGNR